MNKYNRIFNFAAGPAMLPEEVLEIAKNEMMNYKNSGMSVMELSHRSLEKVKKIRNKLEHEMHGAFIVASSSGNTSMFSATYRIGETDVCIRASEIMDFVKEMNTLFSKLQGLVKQFAYDSQYSGHPYFKRLVRCDFADFNRILESDLLYYFGKTLQAF